MRRLMWFSVGFGFACLAAVYALPLSSLLFCAPAAAVFSAVVLLLRRRYTGSGRNSAAQELRILSAVLLGFSLGLLWYFRYETVIRSPARALVGKKQSITAELCSFPQNTETACQVEAILDPDGRRVKTRLYLYGTNPSLRPGDRISGVFTIRPADQNSDGSANRSLPAKGILLTGSGQISAVEEGGDPLHYFPARLSHAAFLQLVKLVPADAAGLPQAMLTGDRSGLSTAKQDELSAAGASHIIAVSGLHVAMLFGLLLLLLGNRGWLTAICGALMLTLYCLMTGASPSVVRACLMLGVFLAAPLLQEEHDPPTALALAALMILLGNPCAIAGLSFQLSFAAVAGLLLVSRPVQEFLLNLPRVRALLTWDGLRRLPQAIRLPLLHLLRGIPRFAVGSFSASLGALVFTVPISAAAFGTLPVYGVLTNLLVLPLASLCLAGALLVLGLGLLYPSLGHVAGTLLALPVRLIFGICRLFSRLPGSRLSMDFYGIAFLLFLYGLLLLALYVREKQLLRPIGTIFAALLLAVWFQQQSVACSDFTLAALDVGQGQCVCI
ncbi:MAG: ComEC/Rec2 family competence protein, partial [Oscillospiraceae bacterium]|nr:ComEC/Rec2 family competence protein [Oscillospiraceae bacterium]